MIISEGHFPFTKVFFSLLFRWKHPTLYRSHELPAPLNKLTVQSCTGWLQFWFLAQLLPAPLMKKICRISSRAGNPLGLGRCKCVMVWLQIPLGGCAEMDSQPWLFVSGTMTFVLAFVVKLLASKFVNVFENLPWVAGFLLTCAITLDGLGGEHCPKAGNLSSAQGNPAMGTVPWLCISLALGRALSLTSLLAALFRRIENLSSVLCVNLF